MERYEIFWSQGDTEGESGWCWRDVPTHRDGFFTTSLWEDRKSPPEDLVRSFLKEMRLASDKVIVSVIDTVFSTADSLVSEARSFLDKHPEVTCSKVTPSEVSLEISHLEEDGNEGVYCLTAKTLVPFEKGVELGVTLGRRRERQSLGRVLVQRALKAEKENETLKSRLDKMTSTADMAVAVANMRTAHGDRHQGLSMTQRMLLEDENRSLRAELAQLKASTNREFDSKLFQQWEEEREILLGDLRTLNGRVHDLERSLYDLDRNRFRTYMALWGLV